MAEDAGFEPARACTQPAFQLSTLEYGPPYGGALTLAALLSGPSGTAPNGGNRD